MDGNNYALKITPAARDDLEAIYQYISDDLYNEPAAEQLMDKIETNFMRLKEFPFSYKYVNDEILKSKGYRKLIVDNYIGLYIVDEL
jgi:toxin ParE1/3/4